MARGPLAETSRLDEEAGVRAPRGFPGLAGGIPVGPLFVVPSISETWMLKSKRLPKGSFRPGTAQGCRQRRGSVGSPLSSLRVLSLSSGGSSSTPESKAAVPAQMLDQEVTDLVGFLLPKYRTKETTTEAEMLTILKDYQDHFPVVFSRASAHSQLVLGLDVKEVDPSNHSYVLVPALGLACDGMLSDGPSMPKPGLLVLVLGLILLEDDFVAPEEEVWGAPSKVGVCAGREHYIYGEPRELLTKVWVQEGYLEYRQVPHCDPARYEFLWGPRAHAETSKWQVLEYLLRASGWDPRSFPSLCAEGVSDDAEGA
ncbi:melanoma-associated antigen 10-like [Eschrichtius robustus]|uniref:melanoma-associated antigen 10-like n=1 Tax=Eschrichtius robustus TaxID=9764 RepID=UPI0035BEB997